ncbi:PHP domain-containing protein [Seleniivibrio woodruffii]|uniref:PHP domain-containing protein n=1 Tax=Seleniivibrio woodruffii TaxID=1078050 RepID=UPI0026F06BF0|nr:PHP domain-containing protein [Seleniivibrio woodruffii]
MIDLHCHSTYSDGTFSPAKLLEYAEKRGVEVLALTDHDTVDGLPDFFSHETKVERVAGTELSIDYDNGTFHVVGLFLDYHNKKLNETLDFLKTARRARNEKILTAVSNLLGREVTLDDVSDGNEGELGRPHIAKFLIKCKVVSTMQEAFDKYLAKGKPLYADKARLSFDDAAKIIHGAGGIAVLAHPVSLRLEDDAVEPFLSDLKGRGLDAIEVFCSEVVPERRPFYLETAQRLGLGVSGGSDFHGDNKLKIALGTGPETLNTPYSVYQALKELTQR